MWKAIFLLIAAYIIVNIPTFHDGLFQVYDNVQVTRIQAMYSELQAGQFPVRYVDQFGYGAGYFLFKYYSPLLYYMGALIMSFGLSAIQAVKLIYLAMMAIGTVGMFVIAKAQTKNYLPATLASVAFISAPYVFHDFFHRGTMTEASALMLIPWAIWSFEMILKTQSRRSIVLGALTLSAIILTHALTGVMAIGLLVLYLLVKHPKIKVTIIYLLAMGLGLGLAGFSLIPALSERNLISYENNSLLERGYLDHPVPIMEQFYNQGSNGEKSAYLGSALMVGLMMLFSLYISSSKFRGKHGNSSLYILIGVTCALYLISPSSQRLWENIVYLRYFQFPFRLLGVATPLLALAIALISDYYQEKKFVTWLLGIMLVLPIMVDYTYYTPLGYQYGTTYTVDDPCKTTTWADEYLSKWTRECVKAKPDQLVIKLDQIDLIIPAQVSEGGRKISFKTPQSGEYVISKYYFPEWRASDENGAELSTSAYGESGLIKIVASKDSTVSLSMTPSKASRLGDWTSMIALAISILLVTVEGQKSATNHQEEQTS